jgi:hypothetical protein
MRIYDGSLMSLTDTTTSYVRRRALPVRVGLRPIPPVKSILDDFD